VTWEWVEIRAGVPAIRDPNGFVTNGSFVDGSGQVLAELSSIIVLNHIAHLIPWQHPVMDLLPRPLPSTRPQSYPTRHTEAAVCAAAEAELPLALSPAKERFTRRVGNSFGQ
jgi:hypothetical protein